ncbi:PA2778 family cysteine peptidase [Ketobacter sp.]|uniref:PA2778 family cysteine peptidase n=1 Tax=Ketobacter sp. TaxID=2083498 RepID=UPI000F1D9C23|nr:PA2778 family cysteine peptidase [Ketobacter sp.]RLU00760.1 MAG: bacteriocin-processing peptidase family protein [Ketobacter sp.]
MKLCALGLSLLLTGCALLPAGTTPQLGPDLLQQLPPSTEIQDTPFIQQADFQCGPASLAMVLQQQGYAISAETLASQVFTPRAEGSFPVEMDIAARRQGQVSYPVNSLGALLQELAAGHPVLVLQNLGVSWYPKWHFAVVIGYDLAARELVLRSGDLPRRITPFAVFDRTWQRSDRWGRVVLPGSRLPATAEPLPYITAAAGLEHSGHTAAALTAYATALQAWPDAHLARFGLANTLLASQQTEAALREYLALLQQQPDWVAAWNNLAYALQAAGCTAQARNAVQCGLGLAPEDPNLLDTLQDLPGPSPDAPACPVIACPATFP